MRLDKYSNPVFDEADLFDALYKGYQFSIDDTLLVSERSESIKQLEKQIGFKFLEPYETHFEVSDYDSACQTNWFMPKEYKDFDIERWCFEQCISEEQRVRVTEELEEYKNRNMIPLLRWLKYFISTMEENNIVWGVGRGSSVASYVLYLLKVHSIDSIKYNLEWQEFLR